MKKTLSFLLLLGFIVSTVSAAHAWQMLYNQDTSVGKSIDMRCDNGTTFRIFTNTYLYKDKKFRYESGSGNVPYKCSSKVIPNWQPGSVANQICGCLGSQ